MEPDFRIDFIRVWRVVANQVLEVKEAVRIYFGKFDSQLLIIMTDNFAIGLNGWAIFGGISEKDSDHARFMLCIFRLEGDEASAKGDIFKLVNKVF